MSTGFQYRIMVVDDDPDVRLIIEETLKNKYEVVTAHDGLDALEKLPLYEPDFIIMDMMMPLLDGLECCTAIRRNPEYKDVQVLFLSAYGTRQSIAKSYESGGNLFMPKPVEPSRLLKNVEMFFEKTPPPRRPKKRSLQQLRAMESKGVLPQSAPEKPEEKKTPAPEAVPKAEEKDTEEKNTEPVAKKSEAPAVALVPRILVVEDDPDLAQLVEIRLGEEFEIVVANDGVEGIEKLVKYQPDLILLDVMLPKMNGYQLCQSIRGNRSFAHTPVIVMTAKTSARDREYAKRMGASHFLPKPFEMDTLYEVCNLYTRQPNFRVRPKTHRLAKAQHVKGKASGPRAFSRNNKYE